MRKRTAGLVLAVVLALAAVAAIAAISLGGAPNSSEVNKATNYLAVNYDPSIGLIPETPGGHVYFVYSDNFLASYVLGRSGNSTLRAIAANITRTDDRYLAKLHNPSNQYEAINSSSGSFFTSSNYVLAHVGGATIEATLNNGTSPLSPLSYADIAFLDALDAHFTGNSGFAANDFNQGVKEYDGTGFDDLAYSNQTSSSYHVYQTYKLALCDYDGKILGIKAPSGLEADLLKMQAPDGGFYTGYSAGFSANGTSTNTETTSLAILALSTSSQKSGGLAASHLLGLVSGVPAAVLGCVATRRRPGRLADRPGSEPYRLADEDHRRPSGRKVPVHYQDLQ